MKLRCLFGHLWTQNRIPSGYDNWQETADWDDLPERRCVRCGRREYFRPGGGGYNPVTGRPWVSLPKWRRRASS